MDSSFAPCFHGYSSEMADAGTCVSVGLIYKYLPNGKFDIIKGSVLDTLRSN